MHSSFRVQAWPIVVTDIRQSGGDYTAIFHAVSGRRMSAGFVTRLFDNSAQFKMIIAHGAEFVNVARTVWKKRKLSFSDDELLQRVEKTFSTR